MSDDDFPDTETIAAPATLSSYKVTIDGTAAGRRLDAVLAAAIPGLSRARLQGLIKDGSVTDGAGDTVGSPSRKAQGGEIYEIALPAPAPAEPQPRSMPLNIVFEDDHLIVVDKPAGLVVHPGSGTSDGTLVNGLLAHCGNSLSGIGGVARPGIVHRIDKDTSGLLVVAKSDAAHQGLSKQFEAHTIKRVYTAVVWGEPRPLNGKIERNIGRHPSYRTKMAVVRSGGRHALTFYKVMERFNGIVTLIECRLATGRTHQIRVHMAHAGNPLLGDRVYGGQRHLPQRWRNKPAGDAVDGFGRQALHAAKLGFDHPVTGDRLSFEALPPADFAALLHSLESLKAGEQGSDAETVS